MFADLKKARELGWMLFRRDVKARYTQKLLGCTWIVIEPLLIVGGFFMLQNGGVIKSGDAEQSKIFLLSTLAYFMWLLVQNLTMNSARMVGNNAGLMSKINFPRIAIISSPVMTSCIDFLIRVGMFLIFCLIFQIPFNPLNLLGLTLLIPGILLGIGVGMFFSIVGSVVRDLHNVLTHSFFFLLLITPILYAAPKEGIIGTLCNYNPMYYLILVPRDFIFDGTISYPIPYLISALFAFIAFLAGWRFFNLSLIKIIEKI
ncbi:MAG: hypothetical protein V3V74_07470 [Nitrosomonadaceae bacterium]